jgi:outer membrane protein assembly factor BamB
MGEYQNNTLTEYSLLPYNACTCYFSLTNTRSTFQRGELMRHFLQFRWNRSQWLSLAIGTYLLLFVSTSFVVQAAPTNSFTVNHDSSRNNWNQFNYRNTRFNPYEHIIGPKNVATLRYKWVDHVAESIFSYAAVVNGTVYLNDFNGGIDAFNASTGTLLWQTETQNLYTDTSVAVADGMVYVGGDSFSRFYAFDAKTGKLNWTFETGNIMKSSPTVADGVVYFGSLDNKIYALNDQTGKLLWSYTTGNEVDASPAVANGRVFVGSHDGYMYVFGALTGTLLWKTDVDPAKYGGVYGVAVDNGKVFASSFYSHLKAFNAFTGKLLWTARGPVLACSPAVAYGVVYIADGNKVAAFQENSGAKMWSYRDPDGQIYSSPAVANGVLYLGSVVGKIIALDTSKGTLLWTATFSGGEVEAAPTVVNGILYIGALDGNLYAFQPGSGTKRS